MRSKKLLYLLLLISSLINSMPAVAAKPSAPMEDVQVIDDVGAKKNPGISTKVKTIIALGCTVTTIIAGVLLYKFFKRDRTNNLPQQPAIAAPLQNPQPQPMQNPQAIPAPQQAVPLAQQAQVPIVENPYQLLQQRHLAGELDADAYTRELNVLLRAEQARVEGVQQIINIGIQAARDRGDEDQAQLMEQLRRTLQIPVNLPPLVAPAENEYRRLMREYNAGRLDDDAYLRELDQLLANDVVIQAARDHVAEEDQMMEQHGRRDREENLTEAQRAERAAFFDQLRQQAPVRPALNHEAARIDFF
jgi:hypothetical protein